MGVRRLASGFLTPQGRLSALSTPPSVQATAKTNGAERAERKNYIEPLLSEHSVYIDKNIDPKAATTFR